MYRSKTMTTNVRPTLFFTAGMSTIALMVVLATAQISNGQTPAKAKTFATAAEAANALIDAAEKFDETALTEILGPDSYDIIHTGEPARDREVAAEFAAKARTKTNIARSAKNSRRAILEIGEDNWPFAIPIVKVGSKWSFDTRAGREELLFRRIGEN